MFNTITRLRQNPYWLVAIAPWPLLMGCNIAAKVELFATASPDGLIRAMQSGGVPDGAPPSAKSEPSAALSDLIERLAVGLDQRRVDLQLNRLFDRLTPARLPAPATRPAPEQSNER